MTATRTTIDVAGAREVVELTLQGAKANERPDLVLRLTKAARLLASDLASAADVRTAARSAADALQSLEIDLRARRSMMSDRGRASRLHAEMEHAQNRLDAFQDRAAEWPQMLGEGYAAVSSDLDFDIRNRVRAVLDEGAALIESGKGSSAQFDAWLRERLVREAEATYQRLRKALQSTGSQITSRLELAPAAPLSALPVLPPEALVSQFAERPQAAGAASPISGRLLGIVMPTYGGTMMTLVLPKFMGIHLAVWLVVASALAGAVTMGGAAIAAERQRQRSRRDSDNVSGLRAVLDGFQIALAKQVRDGVRTVQQDLRRVLTGAITQRGLTLSAEATAAQQAVDQISRMGDALSDINADLTSMRELRDRARQLARPEDPQPETRPLAASAS